LSKASNTLHQMRTSILAKLCLPWRASISVMLRTSLSGQSIIAVAVCLSTIIHTGNVSRLGYQS
jgi:hypothetical protein